MFTAKHNAKRAARAKLGPEAREGKEFLIYEQDGKWNWRAPTPASDAMTEAAAGHSVSLDQVFGGDALGFKAERKRRERKAKIEAASVAAIAQRYEEKAAAPHPTSDPVGFDLPTPFAPDFDAGEIASSEYGMLTTRERAMEAAGAAGVPDPVLTHTARGMWIWRTQTLDAVWKENAKPKQEPKDPSPTSPKGSKTAGQPQRQRKMTAKHETALKLIKRPTGATAAEVAEATGWQEHSARARIAADLKGAFGFEIVKVSEPGRGKVYRLAAEQVAAAA